MVLFGYIVQETTDIGVAKIVLGTFESYIRRKNKATQKKVCVYCGKEDYNEGYPPGDTLDVIKERGVCAGCAFWILIAEKNPLWCRIGGVSYTPEAILKEDQEARQGQGRGFGGAEFHVEMDDGTKFRTDDLWCQGAMPDWIRDMYPDNARFTQSVPFR